MSDLGKLCYKHGVDALAYKRGIGSLIYKAAPKAGDITLIITAAQAEVGPIKSCGNTHSVVIAINGTSGAASLTTTVAKGTQTLSGTTQSSGCAYPNENPPMQLTVVAIQPTPGVTKQTAKSVSNVATGTFSITITCADDGKLTGVS